MHQLPQPSKVLLVRHSKRCTARWAVDDRCLHLRLALPTKRLAASKASGRAFPRHLLVLRVRQADWARVLWFFSRGSTCSHRWVGCSSSIGSAATTFKPIPCVGSWHGLARRTHLWVGSCRGCRCDAWGGGRHGCLDGISELVRTEWRSQKKKCVRQDGNLFVRKQVQRC